MGRLLKLVAGAVLAVGGIYGASAVAAQDATDASLGAQLKEQYKLAKAGLDSGGWSVVQPGTVMTIQKGGMVGVPIANLTVAQSTFKDGDLKGPNGGAMMMAGTSTKQLTIGEKVYVLKIDVHVKNDKVVFWLIECDACNNVQQASNYKTAVAFQFPKDYLSKADIGQVKDFIGQLLSVDAEGGDQQQQQTQQPAAQQQAPAQAPPAAQPTAATQTVELGQTPEQVKAALGAPEKVVNLGAKQIYVYKDLKITFVNGKVSDVQ